MPETFTTSTSLYESAGLAVDSQGFLYVVDQGIYRIVKFLPNGTAIEVFTTKNPNLNQPKGVGIEPSTDDVWICDTVNQRLVQIAQNGTQLSVFTTTNPTMYDPSDVAFDSFGNMYVVDRYNNRVVKRSNIGTVTTFCSGLNLPTDVVLDAAGNVIISDTYNNRILQVSPAGALLQILNTASPTLNGPSGLTVDSAGNLYVADFFNFRIVVFFSVALSAPSQLSSAPLSTPFSSSAAAQVTSPFFSPSSPSGSFSPVSSSTSPPISSSVTSSLRSISSSPLPSSSFTSAVSASSSAPPSSSPSPPPLSPSSSPQVNGLNPHMPVQQHDMFYSDYQVTGIAVDSETGIVFMSDVIRHRIVKQNSTGFTLGYFTLSTSAGLFTPMALSLFQGGLYVGDQSDPRVVCFNATDGTVLAFIPAPTGFEGGGAVVVSSLTGELWVADQWGGLIALLSSTTFSPVWTVSVNSMLAPSGGYISSITADSSGTLYAANSLSSSILQISHTGAIITTNMNLNYSGAVGGPLALPTALWWSSASTIPSLYVYDQPPNLQLNKLSRLVQFSAAGVALFEWYGVHAAFSPEDDWAIAVDAWGYVYLSDDGYDGHGRVVKFSAINANIEVQSFTSPNDQPLALIMPMGLAYDASTCTILASNGLPGQGPVRVAPDGTLLNTFPTSNIFYSLVVDHTTNTLLLTGLYTPTSSDSVWRLSMDGVYTQIESSAANLSNRLGAVVVDGAGNLFVSDLTNNSVVKMSGSGVRDWTYNTSAVGLSFVVSRNQGSGRMSFDFTTDTVFLADQGNARVVRLSATATVLMIFNFSLPTVAVLYDAASDHLFVSLLESDIYQLKASSGAVLNVLTPVPLILDVVGMALDSASNLYASDWYDYRIVVFANNVTEKLSLSSTACNTTESSPASGLVSGSLCFMVYGTSGNVDYPWSSATAVSLLYNSTVVFTAAGTAVRIVSGSGIRTYTNRFGVSFSIPLTVSSSTTNLLYLGSPSPVDSHGLTWTLSSPVQLPGEGPSVLFSLINVYASSNGVVESNRSRQDSEGVAFLSNVPGFTNLTIGASNINSLAANYGACQAPITFTNGLRTPTQPSSFNGGVHITYSYFVSDGETYSVATNLSLTAASAFATLKDQLGNPYQIVVNVTGSRTYIHLPTGAALTSQVSYASRSPPLTLRFYPYTLLSSSPGVYTPNTAPYLDGDGITFAIQPSAPINGNKPGIGPQYNATTIAFVTYMDGVILNEANYISAPSPSLQQQQYII